MECKDKENEGCGCSHIFMQSSGQQGSGPPGAGVSLPGPLPASPPEKVRDLWPGEGLSVLAGRNTVKLTHNHHPLALSCLSQTRLGHNGLVQS